MKPLTLEELEAWWNFLRPMQTLAHDDGTAQYEEWWDGDGDVSGMKHIVQGQMHGVCRKITLDGDIIEGTWRNGLRHGFQREITSVGVKIQVFQDFERIAQLCFDFDFGETYRDDP